MLLQLQYERGNRRARHQNSLYSVFLWIPRVAFCYPEIKATEVKGFKAENVTSVAFISGYTETKLGEIQGNTLYILEYTYTSTTFD